MSGKTTNFTMNNYYLYEENFWMNNQFPAKHLNEIRDFQFKADDVMIASYPKAGTTWTQELVYLIQTGDFDTAKSRRIDRRSAFLEFTATYNGLRLAESLSSPRELKTHLPFRLFEKTFDKQKPKVIIVMRNLKDNLVSYYNFYKATYVYEFQKGMWKEFFDLFKEKKLSHGDWFDFNLGWWQHRDDPNFLFVTYEEMKADIRDVIGQMAQFLNRKLTPETVEAIVEHTSFKNMKSNDMVNYSFIPKEMDSCVSAFMRKGQVGDWVNYFTEDQLQYCNILMDQKLSDASGQLKARLSVDQDIDM